MPEQQKHWLLARFGRVRGLTLEIVAIFIGITASFWVDEWREERADYEILDRALESIYYDALRDRAWATRELLVNNARIALLHDFLFTDTSGLSHQEYGARIGSAFSQGQLREHSGGYDGLVSADISLPFDSTLQALRFNYEEGYFDVVESLRRRIGDARDLAYKTFEGKGFVTNEGVSQWDMANNSVSMVNKLDLPQHIGIRELLIADGAFLPDKGNLLAMRTLRASGELEATFRELLQIRLDQNYALMSMIWITEGIESVVRERLASPELPIDALGLRGSAIDGIWAETKFLVREAQDGWWSADVVLEDGMVKFLANEDYAISWGVEPDWSKVEPFEDPTHFLGDPAAVFPTGTAVFDGQNIPVTAGRYRVRFNSRTFEYSFELL